MKMTDLIQSILDELKAKHLLDTIDQNPIPHIKSIHDCDSHFYLFLESQQSLFRLKQILIHLRANNGDVTPELLEPLFRFLSDRFDKIAGTSAFYCRLKDSPINQACCLLAKKIKPYHVDTQINPVRLIIKLDYPVSEDAIDKLDTYDYDEKEHKLNKTQIIRSFDLNAYQELFKRLFINNPNIHALSNTLSTAYPRNTWGIFLNAIPLRDQLGIAFELGAAMSQENTKADLAIKNPKEGLKNIEIWCQHYGAMTNMNPEQGRAIIFFICELYCKLRDMDPNKYTGTVGSWMGSWTNSYPKEEQITDVRQFQKLITSDLTLAEIQKELSDNKYKKFQDGIAFSASGNAAAIYKLINSVAKHAEAKQQNAQPTQTTVSKQPLKFSFNS